jgi:short-subunit dehydrogenase
LILSGRRRDSLEALAERLQGSHLVLPFEATDWPALTPAVESAWSWRDGVDILVNNAGISQRSLAIDTRPDVYRRLIETDLLAPIWLTQTILPLMAERRGGHIVAIASVAGRVGTPLRTGYCAAKHGLIGYFDALRAEVEEAYGIAVTNVLPGSVRTNVSVNALQGDGSRRGVSDINIEHGLEPAECARLILAGVAAGARELVVAQGTEAGAAELRRSDPERLFGLLAREGARLAAQREAGGGSDWRPEPARTNRPAAADPEQ